MQWWMWVLLGLGLSALELVTPGGFFVLFFGLAAFAVGLLVAIGLGGDAWVQWLWFSVLSVASLLLFRRRLLDSFGGRATESARLESLVGEVCVLREDLAAGGIGKAELRGTVWSARNVDDRGLVRDQRCRVERVEGLMLWVRADER